MKRRHHTTGRCPDCGGDVAPLDGDRDGFGPATCVDECGWTGDHEEVDMVVGGVLVEAVRT